VCARTLSPRCAAALGRSASSGNHSSLTTAVGSSELKESPVTTYEAATISLGVLQLFVSALGFVVVAWTLRVLLRTLDAQSSAGVATRQLEFDKVILEHPDVYRYFYQGQDVANDDPEYTRVMAATQLLANYFDGYFQQQGMYRQMWPDIKWKSYIQDHVAKSPVLRRYVVENSTWFAPEFVQMSNSPAPNTAT
jgi:hypothetical protein